MSFTVCMQLSSQCIYPCIYNIHIWEECATSSFHSPPPSFFHLMITPLQHMWMYHIIRFCMFVYLYVRVFMFKCMYACMFDVYMCESVYVHVFIDTRVRRGGGIDECRVFPLPYGLLVLVVGRGVASFFTFFSSSELFCVK